MTSPWRERRVIAYAHQGGELEGPSSTLYAVERALAGGASAIELDVHATVDGVLVVGHDDTVERTTNGSGRIAGLSLGELRLLDNAFWFVEGAGTPHDRPDDTYTLRGRGPADRRFAVATLDEMLELLEGVTVNLDIKETAPVVAPYEELLAATLRRHRRRDDVIVASFFDEATARFSAFAPEIATAPGQNEITHFVGSLLSNEEPNPAIARHAAIQIPPRFSGLELVTEQLVDRAHGLGLAVHVWTVDEPIEIARLCDLGVDGVMSDRPSVLVATLRARGELWDG